MGDSGGDPPKPRNPVKDFEKWLQVYQNELPEMLASEDESREYYDPIRAERDIALQETFGPAQSEQTLARLRELDPEGQAIRGQMASNIYKANIDPYGLPDDLRIEAENDIRGAQTARGNFLGNGAVTAEALYKGRVRQDMAQRNIENAGKFLGTPSPITQGNMVPRVTPDRSAAYTMGGMPTVGIQGAGLGQSAYSNQLAAYNAQGPSPWQTALVGAASGYAQGGWTGAAIGAAAGYYGGTR